MDFWNSEVEALRWLDVWWSYYLVGYSGIAWLTWKLFCLSVWLADCPPFCLSVCLPVCFCLFGWVANWLPFFLFVWLFSMYFLVVSLVVLSVCVCVWLFYLSGCGLCLGSDYLSVCKYVCLYVCLPVWLALSPPQTGNAASSSTIRRPYILVSCSHTVHRQPSENYTNSSDSYSPRSLSNSKNGTYT